MFVRSLAVLSTCLSLTGTITDAAKADFSGEPARWIQNPALSPDGKVIAFTHRGQVFMTDYDGGLSIPVSPAGSYSHNVVWSPDSKQIAFASDVNGDDDVYLADFSGKLQRMTFSSAPEIPTSFSPDGKEILYTAPRLGDHKRSVQVALSRKPQLYTVDIMSGREKLLLPNLAREASWNPSKTKLVYSYNPSTDPVERQHRVAANARQLWFYDPANDKHIPVFSADGIDRFDPHWSADGKALYYLSEASGWLNVWRFDLETAKETQLTNYEGSPVRDLTVASDGTIAFSLNGQVQLLTAGASKADVVEINTLEQGLKHLNNYVAETTQNFRSSPDGQYFALIANTDVFLIDLKGNYRQITATPGEERDITFSPDGRMLTYAAMRDHKWGIYGVDLTLDQQNQKLGLTHKEIPLVVPDNGNALDPKFSPDGSKLAFWADRREVKVLDLTSGKIATLYRDADYNSDYFDNNGEFSWSPNSKDLMVQWRRVDGSMMNRVAIAPADGSAPLQPIFAAVPNFFSGFWSADGSQLIGSTTLFASHAADYEHDSAKVDLYRIFLSAQARQDFMASADEQSDQKPADQNNNQPAVKAKRYQPDRLRNRMLEGRLSDSLPTPNILDSAPDGRSLVAIIPNDGNFSVNLISLDTGVRTELASIPVATMSDVQFTRYNAAIQTLDIKTPSQIIRVSLNDPTQRLEVPLNILFTRDEDSALIAAFEQAWADINYRYYDAAHENRDWQEIGEKYRKFLPSIAGIRDLKQLLAAMLGELSASHLYTEINAPNPDVKGTGTQNDALGIYPDYGYNGPGIKIAAILPGGPMDRQNLFVSPGDIITSINGRPIPEAGGIARLLDANGGSRVVVGLADKKPGTERFIEVTPINWLEELGLSYQRLIEARRMQVYNLSRQCIAYQHLAAMHNDDYLGLLGTIAAERGRAKAVLVDVRSNTGGNLTKQLITQLNGKPAFITGVDNRPQITGPENIWLWPSAVLVDSFSYSDGSIFPQAYQEQKIGKLIGDLALNTGTYVSKVKSKIIPGLLYGIPVLPARHVDGRKYENEVITPDILVPFDPNRISIDSDPQLEAAVASLMQQVGPDSDCRDEIADNQPTEVKVKPVKKK